MLRLLVLTLSLVSFISVQSQNLRGDVNEGESNSIEVNEKYRKDCLYNIYLAKTGGIYRFINGRDYFQYFTRSRQKPILFFGKECTGSVAFKNGDLTGVTLQYDTYLDEVIFTDPARLIYYPFCNIALNHSTFISFTLAFPDDTLKFRYFRPGDQDLYNLKEGFYEVVYDGKTKYLIKHMSSVVETNGIRDYYYKPAYFLLRDKKYVRVKSPAMIIRLLGTESPEMGRFVREHKMKSRNVGKKQVVDFLTFYDSQTDTGPET
jgi:hypothetical protein